MSGSRTLHIKILTVAVMAEVITNAEADGTRGRTYRAADTGRLLFSLIDYDMQKWYHSVQKLGAVS